MQKPAPPPPPPPPPPRNAIQSSSSGSCSSQVYYGASWNSIYVLPYMSIIRVVRLTATSSSFCDPVQISIYSSGDQFLIPADLCQPSVVCMISKVLPSRCRISVGGRSTDPLLFAHPDCEELGYGGHLPAVRAADVEPLLQIRSAGPELGAVLHGEWRHLRQRHAGAHHLAFFTSLATHLEPAKHMSPCLLCD